MTCEIREICGDWALYMNFQFETVTIYFNSRQNALNVKRILEVDKSIPNCATVCDMQEVVRCKDCRCSSHPGEGEIFCERFESYMPEKGFCSCGERLGEE